MTVCVWDVFYNCVWDVFYDWCVCVCVCVCKPPFYSPEVIKMKVLSYIKLGNINEAENCLINNMPKSEMTLRLPYTHVALVFKVKILVN